MSKVRKPGKPDKPGSRKRRNTLDAGLAAQKKSINALKTKIRDTERLLKHADDLPADVRIEKERALKGYMQDVEKIANDKARSKMITKYHKVRFFERQKATRILKKLTRLLNSGGYEPEATEDIETAIKNAQIDLNYTIYSPLTEKYQSLYADRKMKKDSEEPLSAVTIDIRAIAQCADGRPLMWDIVKRCTEEGSLESLREGKLSSRYEQGGIHPAAVSDKSKVSIGNQKPRNKQSALPKARSHSSSKSKREDDSSDGGFFE